MAAGNTHRTTRSGQPTCADMRYEALDVDKNKAVNDFLVQSSRRSARILPPECSLKSGRL